MTLSAFGCSRGSRLAFLLVLGRYCVSLCCGGRRRVCSNKATRTPDPRPGASATDMETWRARPLLLEATSPSSYPPLSASVALDSTIAPASLHSEMRSLITSSGGQVHIWSLSGNFRPKRTDAFVATPTLLRHFSNAAAAKLCSARSFLTPASAWPNVSASLRFRQSGAHCEDAISIWRNTERFETNRGTHSHRKTFAKAAPTANRRISFCGSYNFLPDQTFVSLYLYPC